MKQASKKTKKIKLVASENNKRLLEREEQEREELKDNNEYSYLYPNLNDPNFIIKIAEKKEFNDTQYDGKIHNLEEYAQTLCNADFELAPHQIFVRNYLSNQTPYNSLLLFHGLGSGKTCTSITLSEEYRQYMKQLGSSQRIIVLANKNVQENYKLQLFDERKLKEINGLWNLKTCTGNKFLQEINPMSMKGISRDKVIKQIEKIIRDSYLFLGYREFGGLIRRRIEKYNAEEDPNKRKRKIAAALKKEFSNRLIIIDEVHNMRISDDSTEEGKVAKRLMELAKITDNMKLLLLSATPMFNSVAEIVWLLNLMNTNDRRATISLKDVFDSNGNLKVEDGKQIGKELLIQKATGYISYVRGDNPYTFPYRAFPNLFAKEHTFADRSYPKYQINGQEITEPIQHINVYLTNIGSYQREIYNKIMENIQDKYSKLSEETIEKGVKFTILEGPLQILNMVYPSDTRDIKEMYGSKGLDKIMSHEGAKKRNFEYKEETLESFGRIFSPEQIGKYSSKIKSISESILKSEGIVLIYSQYIDGGAIPMALALEELGFTRYGGKSVPSLFKTPPSEGRDALTMKPKSSVLENYSPAHYALITGDIVYSPATVKEIKALTDDKNKEGKEIKVVIITRAASEGIDLKNIRQVHIVDPWYNMNRIEQIIGRAVRTKSHCMLPFIKRNVEIYLYATLIGDDKESADLYLYRFAEDKAVKVGKVTRILKQVAVDCLLNQEQNNFSAETFNTTVPQILSSGLNDPNFSVGDMPYTANCDYMESCSYQCLPTKTITDKDINYDSYDETYVMMNTEIIIQKIKESFKNRYFYTKIDLIKDINQIRVYPLVQIHAALDQLLNDKREFLTDIFGRHGYLVNIGDYYLFQPLELTNKHISVFDRQVPIDYKRSSIDIEITDKHEGQAHEETIENIQESGENSIENAINLYQIAIGEVPPDKQMKKEWYGVCPDAISRLNKDANIPLHELHKFVLEHIIESLSANNYYEVLQYVYLKPELSPLEKNIKEIFEKEIIENKGIMGIIIADRGKLGKFYILEGQKWNPAQAQDILDLQEAAENKFKLNPSILAILIGYLTSLDSGVMVFKTIEPEVKRRVKEARLSSLGARCEQAGKQVVIQKLITLTGEARYSEKEYVRGKTPIQLCCEEELYLRYNDKIKKDDKRWFLSPVEAIYTRLV